MAKTKRKRRDTGKSKIFEISFGRTGTNSLTEAMSILGFRSIHGLHTARQKRNVLLRTIYGRCDWVFRKEFDFFCNFPVGVWKLLPWRFPEAKFILLIREQEGWWDSMRRLMKQNKAPLKSAVQTFRYYLFLVLPC